MTTTLTCRDLDDLIDAFVDSELPPASLLDVARHAAQCSACEARIQAVTAIGHVLGTTVRHDAATLDLSGVWAAVERRIDVVDTQHHRDHRWDRWRQAFAGPTLPAWGTAAAIAASAALFLQPVQQTANQSAGLGGTTPSHAPGNQVAYRNPGKGSLNQALIARIKGSNVQVRQVPKDGTTAIWVSYSPDGAR